MRITTTMITMTVLIGLGAHAAEPAGPRPVTVCMGLGALAAESIARILATKMFADIGIILDWRSPRACSAEAILISFTGNTPKNLLPGALAYALPYEGVHIRVFYDRIRRFPRELVPLLLAHVLVHEITHILQGISNHSASGVMKACWKSDDFSAMMFKPLRFEDQDIDLIRRGLAARAARTTVAMNAGPASVRLNKVQYYIGETLPGEQP
jgi:hypothetical protein